MQATPDDKLQDPPKRGGAPVKLIVLAVAVVVALFLLLYPRGDAPVDEAPPDPAPAALPEPLPPAPDIPPRPEPVAQEPAEPAEPAEEPAPALPALEDSDKLLREEISSVGGDSDEFSPLVEEDNLIARVSALVDGTSRGTVLRKNLPLSAPEEPFAVDVREGQIYLDPEGYERYDGYAQAIAKLDVEAMAESFHRLRPLYEQAYAQLGLDPEDFDNAVIRTLDRILATPELEGPIPLEQDSVMYTYADPELESLPSLQKQLLRMGPENLRLIKQQAQTLREELLR
ncbi:DUF3014 domain-containing protein [Kineobactrum salinum]|uniref:DUF3014 domain-containing protein n=1 Tax=Kineobactrum salinum TaxID=2708301 RepID=A0A6C0U1J4_9GAMM|nr:DUF3014 domain-containing protein [Kineobactrum salinum]QIB65419.1 DUF3014 domain-containing protein [Kineobactrum salinum]